MNPTKAEGTSETAPLNSEGGSSSYFPIDTARKTASTNYFLASTLIASIIPIIQVSIGATFNEECPIDQRIGTYMIVAGSVGLVLVGLSLLLIFTFRCLVSDSVTLTVVATGGICCNLFLTIFLSIFSFIWFILGCVWVFSVSDDVQFTSPSQPDYCQPVLYKSAYALLVITIIWFLVQFFISCYRMCCGRSSD